MIQPINPTETVEDLELADRTALTKKYEALEVLLNEQTEAGKAFKTLVLDGYLKEKPAEVTSLLAIPSMKPHRGEMFEELAAISHFEYYLKMVQNLGAPVIEDDEDVE